MTNQSLQDSAILFTNSCKCKDFCLLLPQFFSKRNNKDTVSWNSCIIYDCLYYQNHYRYHFWEFPQQVQSLLSASIRTRGTEPIDLCDSGSRIPRWWVTLVLHIWKEASLKTLPKETEREREREREKKRIRSRSRTTERKEKLGKIASSHKWDYGIDQDSRPPKEWEGSTMRPSLDVRGRGKHTWCWVCVCVSVCVCVCLDNAWYW